MTASSPAASSLVIPLRRAAAAVLFPRGRGARARRGLHHRRPAELAAVAVVGPPARPSDDHQGIIATRGRIRIRSTVAAGGTGTAITATATADGRHFRDNGHGHHHRHHSSSSSTAAARSRIIATSFSSATTTTTTWVNDDGVGGVGRGGEEGGDGVPVVGMEALLDDDGGGDGGGDGIDSRRSGGDRKQPPRGAGSGSGSGGIVAGDDDADDDFHFAGHSGNDVEEEASKIERYPPGFLTLESQDSHSDRMDKITAVMRRARDLRSVRGARIAEAMLRKVLAEGDWWHSTGGGAADEGDDVRRLHPTRIMYTLAMDAWAKSVEGGGGNDGVGRRRHRAERAEAVLDLMQSHHELHLRNRDDFAGGENDGPPRPDAVCFTAVMNAHARTGNAEGAQSLLERMIRLSDGDGDGDGDDTSNDPSLNPDARPDAYAFRTVLSAWTRHDDPRVGLAGARAVVDEMTRLSSTTEPERYRHVRPDTRTYNTLLHAYVNCSDPSNPWAAEEAEGILDSMLKSSTNGPDAVTFHLVMNAHARGVQPRGAKNAERLLDRMLESYRTHRRDGPDGKHGAVRPTDRSFHTVLKAWANASPFRDDAARRAEKILGLMNELYISDTIEWAQLRPTTMGYNTVLSAWARSRRRGAAEHAENILRHMEGLAAVAAEGGGAGVKPDRVSYNTVISAWSRSDDGDAPARARALLEGMHEMHQARAAGGARGRERGHGGDTAIRPDNFGFSAAISAWCGRAYVDDEAAGRAQDLLDWMERLGEEEDEDEADDDDCGRRRVVFVRPDAYNYVAVMKAWMRTKDGACPPRLRVERTSELLRRMEESYQRTGDNKVRPNTAAYNIVLSACASMGDGGDVKTQSGSLDDEEGEASAEGGSAEEAFEIAWETFLKACDSTGRNRAAADSRTYQLTLGAITDLLPLGTERISRAEEVFERCCAEGLVTEGVFRQLRAAILADQFDKMLPAYVTGGAVEYRNLPPKWTRHAKRGAKGHGGRGTGRR